MRVGEGETRSHIDHDVFGVEIILRLGGMEAIAETLIHGILEANLRRAENSIAGKEERDLVAGFNTDGGSLSSKDEEGVGELCYFGLSRRHAVSRRGKQFVIKFNVLHVHHYRAFVFQRKYRGAASGKNF